MARLSKIWAGLWRRNSSLRNTSGAALIEFAVALPLLVVLVVGVFDFGEAFNLKQELNNAAREGARFGASQPTNDLLNSGTPPSVDAVRYLVASYLQAERLNDCGLASMSAPANTSAPFAWTYSATGCVRNLVLTIQRPCSPMTSCPKANGPPSAYMPYTFVQISYPYQWHFNNVIQLLVPGANFALSNIAGNATAVNMD
jgi:Flp pilus assembly protein TadG